MTSIAELDPAIYASTAQWPLETWSDGMQTFIECAVCGSGQLVRARDSFVGKQFVLVELILAIVAHMPTCVGFKTGKVSNANHH